MQLGEFWNGALEGFGAGIIVVVFVMASMWNRALERARAEARNQVIANLAKERT